MRNIFINNNIQIWETGAPTDNDLKIIKEMKFNFPLKTYIYDYDRCIDQLFEKAQIKTLVLTKEDFDIIATCEGDGDFCVTVYYLINGLAIVINRNADNDILKHLRHNFMDGHCGKFFGLIGISIDDVYNLAFNIYSVYKFLYECKLINTHYDLYNGELLFPENKSYKPSLYENFSIPILDDLCKKYGIQYAIDSSNSERVIFYFTKLMPWSM